MSLPILLVLPGLALAGCQDGSGGARVALASYFDAVQSGDTERITSLLADCRADDCADRLAELEASVVAQRELSEYRFDDPWGFGLIGALVLGRGGYWTTEQVDLHPAADPPRAEAVLRVRTQYNAAETRGLPDGARIEYLVEPLGRVFRLTRGSRAPGGMRRELREILLRAELHWLPDAAGRETWYLASLVPVRESARFVQVIWRPE